MATPSDEQDELRRRVLGLEASGRKSHYASLRQRVVELERFRSVIDLAGDLLFIVDVASGRLLDANATACDRLAVPRDDITSVDLARILSEAPRAELSRLLADFQAGLRESITLVTAIRLDAGDVPVEIAARCVPAGDALCFVLAARDVTDRLKAEAEQRKLEEQLRQAQKMEAVGRLAGGVAHDFNNLLTVITGYGQMLIEENVGTEEQRENLRAIVDAAHQASSLTGQLLAFSRKQVLRPVALDLNALVLDADRMLKRLIPEDIEVVTNLAPGLPCIRADAGQVQQVLLNLALNARDAMPSGGRLTFATSLLRSVPAGSPWPADSPAANGLVRLAVSDNGAGIAPDTLAHVFEPFFTTKERGKGTGLGLSTVYGIVTQSGGTIGVQSEPGRGTTFEILLPAAGEPRAAVAPRPAQAIGGTETVLVVEDQSDVRRMVALVLERLGYHVLQAASGEEALRLLTSHQDPLDLLVTDVVMPGMTGDHLARLLRLARPGLPVLFMSGYADRLVMERELAKTQASFLQKPFSPAVLAARVRAVLDAPPSPSPGTGAGSL